MGILTKFGICMVSAVSAHLMAERALRTRGIGVFMNRVKHFRSVASAYRIPDPLKKGDDDEDDDHDDNCWRHIFCCRRLINEKLICIL